MRLLHPVPDFSATVSNIDCTPNMNPEVYFRALSGRAYCNVVMSNL